MSELTHEELTRLLDYDPETGVFRWKVSRTNKVKVGHVASSSNSPTRRIMLNGESHSSRRLAWFYINKEWPRNNLFVKNGNPADDSIKNIGMLPDRTDELTQEYLKECIYYNPKTGEFKWKITGLRNVYGENAFCVLNKLNGNITLQTGILGKIYKTLRLIVLWMTGYMPSANQVVMPIDNNTMNLKWDNIKVGNMSEARAKARTYGNCAFKGIYYNKRAKKYQASITINGNANYLGLFPTEAEAHAAYIKAARKHYGALANDGYQHAMYEMEYEEVEQPVEPDLDEDIKVAAQEVKDILDGKIQPVIHHPDDF